jgi:hypothetical protein
MAITDRHRLCEWCNHDKNFHTKEYYDCEPGNPLSAIQEEICLSGNGCFCGGFKDKIKSKEMNVDDTRYFNFGIEE